jgi:hypothetical protein
VVEHFHGKEVVVGSIPIDGSIYKHPSRRSSVLRALSEHYQKPSAAQRHFHGKEVVVGSIPIDGSIENSAQAVVILIDRYR